METLWFIFGVVIIALGLLLSIALHELGHYLPAKKFGVYIPKFMIGFGKTLWSTKKGETEFGIKMLPLGGYVSMAGMFPPDEKEQSKLSKIAVQDEAIDPEMDPARSFYNLPTLKRIIIMLGGPFANLIIAVVLFAVLIMGFGTPNYSTSIAAVNECVVAIDQDRNECLPSDPEAPGKSAGLIPGDRIISWDGITVSNWLELTPLIESSPNKNVSVVYIRNDQQYTTTVTPMLTTRYAFSETGEQLLNPDGSPVYREVGFVGIVSQLERAPGTVVDVFPAVGNQISAVTGVIIDLPNRLIKIAEAAFGGAERDPNGPMSIIGVGRVAGEIASYENLEFSERVAGQISLLAAVNVALFVFNLVPLLPLDGGHILAAVVDGARRTWAKIRKKPMPRPINIAKLVPLTLVVIVLLGGMSLMLMYADIVRPVSLF